VPASQRAKICSQSGAPGSSNRLYLSIVLY
jgi:hypothetical protein